VLAGLPLLLTRRRLLFMFGSPIQSGSWSPRVEETAVETAKADRRRMMLQTRAKSTSRRGTTGAADKSRRAAARRQEIELQLRSDKTLARRFGDAILRPGDAIWVPLNTNFFSRAARVADRVRDHPTATKRGRAEWPLGTISGFLLPPLGRNPRHGPERGAGLASHWPNHVVIDSQNAEGTSVARRASAVGSRESNSAGNTVSFLQCTQTRDHRFPASPSVDSRMRPRKASFADLYRSGLCRPRDEFVHSTKQAKGPC
jgi:hypothetical protein